MNLTRTTFDILADAVASKLTPDIFAAFHAEPAAAKRDIIQEICNERGYDFPLIMITEFVIAMALEVNAGSASNPPLHDIDAIAKELGVTLDRTPITWAKPKHPKLYPELVMQWPEEYALLGTAAAKIPFAAIGSHEWSRNAVHEALGLGGYLEYLLGRQIPAENPTMQLFHMGIHTMLKGLHGEWFDDEGTVLPSLPKGVSGASTEMLAFTSDLEDRLRRKKVAQESAAKRREAAIAEKTARRNEAFTALGTAQDWQDYADALSCSSFKEIYDTLTSAPYGQKLIPAGMTWLSKDVAESFEVAYPIKTPENIEFAEQFILHHLNKRLPTWFKTTQDGTLKIRRAPLKVRKPGMDRPTRSLHKKLEALIEKHGESKVGDALLLITGSVISWADISASTEMSKAK